MYSRKSLLLGSGLLRWFLGGRFLSSWLLCLGFGGSFLWCFSLFRLIGLCLLGFGGFLRWGLRFLWLVCLSFLGSLSLLLGCLDLLWLSGLGLLYLLGFRSLLGGFTELEASRGTGSLGVLQGVVLDSGTEGHLQVGVHLGFVITNLEVFADVLKDGLARGTSTFLQGRNGLLDHLTVLGVSGGNLRPGCSLLLGCGSLGWGRSGDGVRHGESR